MKQNRLKSQNWQFNLKFHIQYFSKKIICYLVDSDENLDMVSHSDVGHYLSPEVKPAEDQLSR